MNEDLEYIYELLDQACKNQETALEAIKELQEENEFLTDTIIGKKMATLTEERRNLLKKMKDTSDIAKQQLEEAQKIKDLYESNIEKTSLILQNIKTKQDETDKYIQQEAQVLYKKQEAKLKKEYESKKYKIEKEYEGKEMILLNKIKIYKIVSCIMFVITTVTFILMIVNM